MKNSVFFSPPTCTLPSCLPCLSTLKMEATCSSETSVDFPRTTRRYVRTGSDHVRCGYGHAVSGYRIGSIAFMSL
jgi:hypothetical protein